MGGLQVNACASSSGAQKLRFQRYWVQKLQNAKKKAAQIRPQVVATSAMTITCNERPREDTSSFE